MGTVYFISWLRTHKVSFTEFWISNRNQSEINALKEVLTADARRTCSDDLSKLSKENLNALTCYYASFILFLDKIRKLLTRPDLLTILRSLVINKLDSCSSVMAGASDILLRRLQSVLNAAVPLVFSARKFDLTTPLLCELHWL